MEGMIPKSFITTVVDKIDIVDLINFKLPLKKAGANFQACCPFHNEKTPSFTVNRNKQFYHCFGCGAHGDAIKFLMEHDNLSFKEAVEEIASKLGLDVPYEKITKEQQTKNIDNQVLYDVLTQASAFFANNLRRDNSLADFAIKHLRERDITGKIAKDFLLGFALPGWDNLKKAFASKFTLQQLEQVGLLIINDKKEYDRFRNRIMFPIRDRKGRVIGFGGRSIDGTEPKYLNSPETEVFHKGEELYGLYEMRHRLRKIEKVIVVEGYLDVIACAQAEIYYTVASLGTSFTQAQLKILLRESPEIIFCFDADQAGDKAANRALDICLPNIDGKNKINFLFLPEGEDPDSFIQKFGKDAFLEKVASAMPLADFLMMKLSSAIDLESIADQTQMVIAARQFFEKIPSTIFKQLMYDRLSQVVGIDRDILANQHKNIPKESKKKTQSLKKLPQFPKSPAIIALALLLLDRELINIVESELSNYNRVDFIGTKLLSAVAKLINQNQAISLLELKEQLPPDLAKRFIPSELLSLVKFIPREGMKEEFLGAVSKIRNRYKEQSLEALLKKAQQNCLSTKEKEDLQKLLVEKSL